ncbi:MAG: methionyl-tRNA formyltransferase [Acidobacteria bacterium]|jgi:methionyl-tRNA formyltransferase|nr:methionyl-tRNA formyltransferase [Acidobacteriota bacterium]
MKIVFMGTPNAAVATSERILQDGHEIVAVWTQPDKPAGRGNKLTASPVKEFAVQNDLPIYQPTKIKTAESLELYQLHNADVAVVVAYGRVLPETFLQAFPRGAINVHFSLLPKYRGAAPVNWAIASGEIKTGVTTMQMDAGLDTGGILLQRETEIGADENAIKLMERLSFLGADLLSETLAMYGELVPQPQADLEATFAPMMKKEDGLIDWNRAAEEISNRVRGFQPFPTSFTKYQDKKLTIWKAEIMENGKWKMENGQILEAKGDDLIVACGEGTVLKLVEIQLEGKRRMPTRDFLNGVRVQAGERLG